MSIQDGSPEAPKLSATNVLASLHLGSSRPPVSLGRAVYGVMAYELYRTLKPPRLVLWMGMATFPNLLLIAVMLLVNLPDSNLVGERLYIIHNALQFILLPQVVTVLCMLLWAVPIVNSELEGQTWIYSVVRPGGRRAMLLGKYIMAVLWTGSCTCVAALAAAMIAQVFEVKLVWSTCLNLVLINWIAAIVYGALLLAIGTVFQRRSMVFAFAYAAGVEAAMGWIPAVINRFTVSYRLRSILMDWMDVDFSRLPGEIGFLWEAATGRHIMILAILGLILLGFTLWRVERSHHHFQSEY